jgi:uncharacterized membrane protein YqjE
MPDSEGQPQPPGLLSLLRKVGITGLGALENRAELLAVELREENLRFVELVIWALATCFLGLMFLVVVTGTVIFLFAPEYRIYAAIGFCVLYLGGAIFALKNLKALATSAGTPFAESIGEVKKDRAWLESLK